MQLNLSKKIIMYQCLFYLQDEKSAIPVNCQIVPRIGDRILIDNRVSGKVKDVCFDTSIEGSVKVGERFFEDVRLVLTRSF